MKRLDKIINESINNYIIKEVNNVYNKNARLNDETCPFLDKVFGDGFTIREMLQYNTAYDRIDYASEFLESLGSGVRRTCFKLNDKYVLKLTNGNHRWQSKNEYDTALLMSGGYDIFPRVIYQSQDFTWSINEYARPISDNECESILGMPMESNDPSEPSLEGFQMWAETKARRSKQSRYKQRMVNDGGCENYYINMMKRQPFLQTLYKLEQHQSNDLDYGTDLNPTGNDFRPSNLGVVDRNGKPTIVLLDGGFIKPFPVKNSIKADSLQQDFPSY